jgi:hypothetical protein
MSRPRVSLHPRARSLASPAPQASTAGAGGAGGAASVTGAAASAGGEIASPSGGVGLGAGDGVHATARKTNTQMRFLMRAIVQRVQAEAQWRDKSFGGVHATPTRSTSSLYCPAACRRGAYAELARGLRHDVLCVRLWHSARFCCGGRGAASCGGSTSAHWVLTSSCGRVLLLVRRAHGFFCHSCALTCLG